MCAEKDFSRPDGFEEIDAFKNDQVYFIDYSDPAADKITRDGPRFIEGLEYLAGLIHGRKNKKTNRE